MELKLNLSTIFCWQAEYRKAYAYKYLSRAYSASNSFLQVTIANDAKAKVNTCSGGKQQFKGKTTRKVNDFRVTTISDLEQNTCVVQNSWLIIYKMHSKATKYRSTRICQRGTMFNNWNWTSMFRGLKYCVTA